MENCDKVVYKNVLIHSSSYNFHIIYFSIYFPFRSPVDAIHERTHFLHFVVVKEAHDDRNKQNDVDDADIIVCLQPT